MFYVYLLESVAYPGRRYVGFSTDIRTRLKAHNAGQSIHTAKFRPWRLRAYFALHDQAKATAFEHYLKSGSGHAFAARHFW